MRLLAEVQQADQIVSLIVEVLAVLILARGDNWSRGSKETWLFTSLIELALSRAVKGLFDESTRGLFNKTPE